jgi:hypothetical protein
VQNVLAATTAAFTMRALFPHDYVSTEFALHHQVQRTHLRCKTSECAELMTASAISEAVLAASVAGAEAQKTL